MIMHALGVKQQWASPCNALKGVKGLTWRVTRRGEDGPETQSMRRGGRGVVWGRGGGERRGAKRGIVELDKGSIGGGGGGVCDLGSYAVNLDSNYLEAVPL